MAAAVKLAVLSLVPPTESVEAKTERAVEAVTAAEKNLQTVTREVLKKKEDAG